MAAHEISHAPEDAGLRDYGRQLRQANKVNSVSTTEASYAVVPKDADRATSTNYLYQEPDCRVERLPDALASTLPGGG